MKLAIKQGAAHYDARLALIFFLPLVAAGKIVRWTLMKDVLVDAGIGWSFLAEMKLHYVELTTGQNNFAMWVLQVFYRVFGIDSYVEYEAVISIIFNVIMFILIIQIKRKVSFSELLFLFASIALLNIFSFCLAKEPVQFLFFLAMYAALCVFQRSSKACLASALIIVVLSALYFREYYVLIIPFGFIAYFILTRVSSSQSITTRSALTLLLVGLFLAYILIMLVAERIDPASYNELIRVRVHRFSTVSAASQMRNLFQTDSLIVMGIDYVLMVIRMMLPIELLRLGAGYIPYIAFQLIVTWSLVKAVSDYIKRNRRSFGYQTDAPTLIAISIVVGFILTSAVFEPDFGSWVRHESVLFPVLLTAFGLTGDRYHVREVPSALEDQHCGLERTYA